VALQEGRVFETLNLSVAQAYNNHQRGSKIPKKGGNNIKTLKKSISRSAQQRQIGVLSNGTVVVSGEIA
jgi:hypothetical protein